MFNFAVRNARMKLVGGDSGRCEREEFIDSVIVAPSERAVVDVLFDAAGEAILEHRTPEHTYRLGSVEVADERAEAGPAEAFGNLRTKPDMLVTEMDFEAPKAPPSTSAPCIRRSSAPSRASARSAR